MSLELRALKKKTQKYAEVDKVGVVMKQNSTNIFLSILVQIMVSYKNPLSRIFFARTTQNSI